MSEPTVRVLQVHHGHYPEIRGGVDRVVTELLQGSEPDGCVLFEVGGSDDRYAYRRVKSGTTIYRRRLRVRMEGNSWLRRFHRYCEWAVTLVQLRNIVRRERITMIHLHTLQEYQLYFRTLSRICRCPYIVTLHRGETLSFPNQPQARQRRWKTILSDAAEITAVSSTLSNMAVTTLSLEKSPTVVRNGIANPQPAHEKPELGISDGRSYAACVGTLQWYKGHDVAISAWGELHKEGVELDLVIVGEGELRQSLQDQAAAQGCAGNVHLVGALAHEQALAVVRDAAMYLMPSRNEGLGIALIEAMALAKPIVASDLDVFRELVSDESSALLYPAEDPPSLARCVRQLLDQPDRAASLARAARRAYEAGFSREAMVEGYVDVYRRCARRSRQSRGRAGRGG